ncbi:hypothetical protein Esti_004020 [Eimeria stiedai]
MECDSPASSTGGWALAVAPQQQQQEESSSSSQFFPAAAFPCSIASLFEATASQGQQPREEQQRAPQSEAPSFSGSQSEPRFYLEYVVLENFKSYRGRHVIGPLQSSVAIIGANGSGKFTSKTRDASVSLWKSNIADAICFALGVTGRRLRSSALMDLRHAAGEETHAPLTAVSLHFLRRSASGVPGEVLLLRRQIGSSSSSSTYSVDGVRVTAEEYCQVLHDKLSLGPHTIAASLLLQGDSSVANAARSPLELARLIERIGSSEDWAEQFAAAESRAATLRREARASFTSKQQLLASLRVLQAQKKEVTSYQEMQQKLTESQVECLLFQLYLADRQAARQSQIETEEGQKAEELLQQLQETLQRAEAADRQRIAVSLQLDQRKTLARKQSLKTGILHTDLVECLERRRFAEQQLEQQRIKLQQKQQECVKLRNLEQELSSEVIRVSREQQRINAEMGKQERSLHNRLSHKQQEQLLQLQQQADGRLEDLRRQLASKQPLLLQATSSLDILERECLELDRRIACLRELEGEAQQKHTTAAETLQQLLREAASVKQAITEANEQSKTSGARREELQALQEDLKQQLSLVRGLQHDSQQQQQLMHVYEELRSKALLQGSLFGTAGGCCAPSSKRFAAAIAAAVGRWKNALITKDVATANAVIQYLKTNCLQAVDLLPLDRLRQQQQQSSRNDQEDVNGEGGSFFEAPKAEALPPQCIWAVDCVACDSQIRPVVEFVLSDCIVVPCLRVAQQLKSSSSFSRFRFVTLEGERLQHSGIYSIDNGAAATAATAVARMHLLQHDELLRRAEEVSSQLQKIDALETGGAEAAQRRQQQLDRLHRLALQQQTKQKAWELQHEQQAQQLQQLLVQHKELQQQCEAQRQRAAALSKEVEDLQEASADAQAAALSGLAKELKVSQAELRSLLLQQQQQQQQRSAAAKLHLQQLRLEAELQDCRSRLENAVETLEGDTAAHQEQMQLEHLTRQLATYEEQLEAAERQQQERLKEQQEQEALLQKVERQLLELREQSSRLLREKAAAAAAATAAKQQQQQSRAQVVHVLQQADALGVKLPLQRGSWKEVQQFLCSCELVNQQHQPQAEHVERILEALTPQWEALSSDRRSFIERHLDQEQRIQSEVQRLQRQRQQLQQQLQQLNPNFKVHERLREVEAQVQRQEEEQQQQRVAAAKAEADLKFLRSNRKAAFMKCFLHCQRVLSLIFAHLSAGGPVEEQQQEQWQQGSTSALMLKDQMEGAWRQGHPQQHQQVNCLGGQAFLDLESVTAVTREEEPFNCGVSLVCKFPTKRFMEFRQLSGGEQHLAGLSLALALSSFNPRVPFLLLDEIDAHLDRARLGRLAALLREISGDNKIQSIFVTHKEKLFSAADLLVGVVGEGGLAESRCFFFDIRPYRQRELPCPAN